MTTECLTCHGTYEQFQDGYRYYHTCGKVADAATKKMVKRADARDENARRAGTDIVIDTKDGTVQSHRVKYSPKQEGKGSKKI